MVTNLAAITILVSAAVFAGERVLIHAAPLPCDGLMEFYDTNGDLADGAEVALVFKVGESSPRVYIEFTEGVTGEFKFARVTIPGLKVQTFTSPVALSAAYPHPCHAIQAGAGEKT